MAVPLPKVPSVAYTLQYWIPKVFEPGLYLYLRYLSLGHTQYEGIVLCVVWVETVAEAEMLYASLPMY